MPEVILRDIPFRIRVHALSSQAPAEVLLQSADHRVWDRSLLSLGKTKVLAPIGITQPQQYPLSVQVGDHSSPMSRS